MFIGVRLCNTPLLFAGRTIYNVSVMGLVLIIRIIREWTFQEEVALFAAASRIKGHPRWVCIHDFSTYVYNTPLVTQCVDVI